MKEWRERSKYHASYRVSIKIDRISPIALEMWDDKFGRQAMYLSIGKDPFERWVVRAISGILYTTEVGKWDSATEAVQSAVEYLKRGTEELDTAINSIPG